MSVTASVPGDSAGQPRPLRADLHIHRREHSGRPQYWLAHPITGRVVRLTGSDFDALTDATRSLGQADRQLIAEADAAGLLAGGRHSSGVRRGRAWWHNPLYIRFPGIRADRVARFLASRTGWLFSTWAVAIWSVIIFAMGAAMLVYAGDVARSLDALVTFQAEHWAVVLTTLAATKVFHELAHAAVCRRMGAAAREIGLLLLCGTPCLYCDVTDSWRVDSRPRRAAIMLAGVYVELIIASLAALIWILSDAGPQRMVALNIVCVCGVSTLVFNLNPLMRYDGYFVLADFLDVPNLRSRAASAWRSAVVRRVAGENYGRPAAAENIATGSQRPASDRRGWAFATYHSASTLYRYLILSALGGWFYLVLSRCGLEPLARAAIVLAVAVLVLRQSNRLRGILMGREGWLHVPRWRRWFVVGSGALLAVIVMFVPVERRVTAPGVVQLHRAVTVYAPRRGRVETVARQFGERVAPGTVLAELDEPAMRIERAKLLSQSGQQRIRLASLKRQALSHPERLDQLDEQTAALQATDDQLRSVEAALDAMTLVAPCDGVVLPSIDSADSQSGGATDAPSRSLTDRLGQTVESGSVWCCIGDEHHKQVILEVDATERRFVEVGSHVQIRLDQSPAEVVVCEVLVISAMRHQSAGSADLRPSDQFRVACRLPEEIAARVRIGATATGMFRGAPLRLWDWCLGRLSGTPLGLTLL